jgi:hypothetical protein
MKNEKDSGAESGFLERNVNRREAIRRMAIALGGAAAGGVLAGLGCQLPGGGGEYSSYSSYLDHMYSSQWLDSYYSSYSSWSDGRNQSQYGSYNSTSAYQSRW